MYQKNRQVIKVGILALALFGLVSVAQAQGSGGGLLESIKRGFGIGGPSNVLNTYLDNSTVRVLGINSNGSQRGEFIIYYRVRNISDRTVHIYDDCAVSSGYNPRSTIAFISPTSDIEISSCLLESNYPITPRGNRTYYSITPNQSVSFAVKILGDAKVANDFRGHIGQIAYTTDFTSVSRYNPTNLSTRELSLRGPSNGTVDLILDNNVWFTGKHNRINWDNTKYPGSETAKFYLGQSDDFFSSCELDEINNTPLNRIGVNLNLGEEGEECFGGGTQNYLSWVGFGDVYKLLMYVDGEKVDQESVLIISDDQSLSTPDISRVEILANQPLWENGETEKTISWSYENIPTDKKFRVGLYSTDGLNTWGNRVAVPIQKNTGTQVVKLKAETNTSWYDRDVHIRVRVYNANGTEWQPVVADKVGIIEERTSNDYYGNFQIVEDLPEETGFQSRSGIGRWFSRLNDFMASQLAGLFALFN